MYPPAHRRHHPRRVEGSRGADRERLTDADGIPRGDHELPRAGPERMAGALVVCVLLVRAGAAVAFATAKGNVRPVSTLAAEDGSQSARSRP